MHLLLRTGGAGRAASLARRTRAACPWARRLAALTPAAPSPPSPLAPRRPTPLLLARASSTSNPSLSTATTTTTAPTQPPQFCRHCGASPMQTLIPEGDTHPRQVCPACGAVEYRNPRLVVGCIVARGHGPAPREVLLCRRAIEPQKGRWTLPAGYLEVGESTSQGARREALEETGADVEVLRPYAHFDVPAIGQAYLLFLARLQPGGKGPAASTAESLETRWFAVVGGEEEGKEEGGGGVERVPWGELAFSSVSTALRLYAEDVARAAAAAEEASSSSSASSFPSPRFFRQHHGVIDRQPGAGPNEAGTFSLRDHTWSGGGA